jgi:hypothetical protein
MPDERTYRSLLIAGESLPKISWAEAFVKSGRPVIERYS